MAFKMLDKVVAGIVTDSLDSFFGKILKDHYDRHREMLRDSKKTSTETAIDYILGKKASYPPDSAAQWKSYYSSLENKVFKQILLIYLKLDINNYLLHKERASTGSRTRTKDKSTLESVLERLLPIPYAFDFSDSVIQLSTGLWATDNEEINLMISSLSNPSINLTNYFPTSKDITDIIVDRLIISHKPRMALFLGTVLHRCEDWNEDFNTIYAFLLISSGQLIEALKYERMFKDKENYQEILKLFFQLCSEWNMIESLNRLNLSVDEENVLNQHRVLESRPVTPSSSQTRNASTPTPSKQKPRNRSIQSVKKASFSDSPARNTRSARKRKTAR